MRCRNSSKSIKGGFMADDENDYPKTVEEAVDRLVAGLSDEDKEKIRGMPENDLIELHFGLGMGIRNRLFVYLIFDRPFKY